MRVRERTKGFRNPVDGLTKTHTFGVPEVIDSDVRFPDPRRNQAITVEIIGVAGSAGANNALVFVGNTSLSARGLFIGFLGTAVLVAAGSGTGDSTHNVFVNLTGALVTGRSYQLVVAVKPNTGEVRAWLDGELIVRTRASAGDFDGAWGGTADGIVSTSGNATISKAAAYVGQVPRHFDSTA